MANVFTIKQLNICPGWLLRKTFSDLGISCYGKLGPGVHCIKVGNGPLKFILSTPNEEVTCKKTALISNSKTKQFLVKTMSCY